MPKVRTSIVIDRPRDEVFAYISDPATQTVWNSGLVEFDPQFEGSPQKGDRSRGVIKVAGKKLKWESEFTDVDAPERLGIRSIEAPFPFEFTFELSERDGGTEVVYHGSAEAMGGFFGKLADPLVVKMYERDMRSNLENLKAILEQA